MNILSISIDFFTTVPGMLILGGVILLLVAIVLFIVASVKAKKEDKLENETPVTETSTTESSNIETAPSVAAIEEPFPALSPFEVEKEEVVTTTAVVEPIKVEEPAVVTYEPTVVETKVEEVIPVVEATIPTVEETFPTIEPYKEETVSTDTIVEPVFKEPEHRPIYGGADPLEATQKMPTIEETHIPYGGVQEVKIVEPEELPNLRPIEPVVIEEPAVVKIEEPVVINEMSAMEPMRPFQPFQPTEPTIIEPMKSTSSDIEEL